ncbi:MAG: septal ring lytic transglycosylase RlpA family protein, partial [Synechococcaceae bacterium WB4_1_0192]|nr:septal ring lytic transglycosylase RlpA family protein [Synechococcaceae bacterium WB4_1_0192]
MRRFVLLSGSALLLSGSNALAPAFAGTGNLIAAAQATSTEIAIREVVPPVTGE